VPVPAAAAVAVVGRCVALQAGGHAMADAGSSVPTAMSPARFGVVRLEGRRVWGVGVRVARAAAAGSGEAGRCAVG
jgi:hypothetical protein